MAETARQKNFQAMLKSGTAGDVYQQDKARYAKDCRWCGAKIVMRKTLKGRWAAYAYGTNNFHQCPNYTKREVTRYP